MRHGTLAGKYWTAHAWTSCDCFQPDNNGLYVLNRSPTTWSPGTPSASMAWCTRKLLVFSLRLTAKGSSSCWRNAQVSTNLPVPMRRLQSTRTLVPPSTAWGTSFARANTEKTCAWLLCVVPVLFWRARSQLWSKRSAPELPRPHKYINKPELSFENHFFGLFLTEVFVSPEKSVKMQGRYFVGRGLTCVYYVGIRWHVELWSDKVLNWMVINCVVFLDGGLYPKRCTELRNVKYFGCSSNKIVHLCASIAHHRSLMCIWKTSSECLPVVTLKADQPFQSWGLFQIIFLLLHCQLYPWSVTGKTFNKYCANNI